MYKICHNSELIKCIYVICNIKSIKVYLQIFHQYLFVNKMYSKAVTI